MLSELSDHINKTCASKAIQDNFIKEINENA